MLFHQDLDHNMPLPMSLPLSMKMDPVFTTFFRSARAAFIVEIQEHRNTNGLMGRQIRQTHRPTCALKDKAL
jgi:hypothetical protein